MGCFLLASLQQGSGTILAEQLELSHRSVEQQLDLPAAEFAFD